MVIVLLSLTIFSNLPIKIQILFANLIQLTWYAKNPFCKELIILPNYELGSGIRKDDCQVFLGSLSKMKKIQLQHMGVSYHAPKSSSSNFCEVNKCNSLCTENKLKIRWFRTTTILLNYLVVYI